MDAELIALQEESARIYKQIAQIRDNLARVRREISALTSKVFWLVSYSLRDVELTEANFRSLGVRPVNHDDAYFETEVKLKHSQRKINQLTSGSEYVLFDQLKGLKETSLPMEFFLVEKE